MKLGKGLGVYLFIKDIDSNGVSKRKEKKKKEQKKKEEKKIPQFEEKDPPIKVNQWVWPISTGK